MDRWTDGPRGQLLLSLQDWTRKKNKRKKKKKEKGAVCGFLCFIQGRWGLGAMREFGGCSPQGWEKGPEPHSLRRVWELGI